MSKEQGQAEGITEPYASSLPQSIIDALTPDIPSVKVDEQLIKDLVTYQRASNYLAAAMIFLTEGPLEPKKELKQEMIKKRLLGHWGTCPGLSLVQAHTNRLIRDFDANIMLVTGPGHGAPGVLSGLWLEGSMTRFYSDYGMDKKGLDKFIKAFSWPSGFPSHVNAETPGQIHEGGELGYALSVAYGSIMDSPDMITVAVIGDGESETGPTATAWHAHKYIDPAESGAVLPILHANGFKISERTIMGTSDDKEVIALFSGYGYQCAIVDYGDMAHASDEQDHKLQVNLVNTFEWAYKEIRKIQEAARSGKPITKPRWPMIFLRTPKGWTGPRFVGGLPVVNSFRAHQVPLPEARSDSEQFEQLKDWLDSYHPSQLFDPAQSNIVKPEVTAILPKNPAKRLGQLKYTYDNLQPLNCPPWLDFSSGTEDQASPMKAVGKYLTAIIEKNPKTFRIFSPDELRSNKLDEVFSKTTRDFQWDPETSNKGGRVIEMLSEHTLQGFLQGYTLTGRTGLFPSYEAFLPIVASMVEQYAKFVKVAQETTWRRPMSSLNYIETSTLWRQEHNGYSHQAPGLINTFLNLPRNCVRVYLPPDANTAVSCVAHCLRSKNYVNLIVGSKSPGRNWLKPDEADKHCIAGISVWKQYSTFNGENPDVVLVGIGVEVTEEVLHAASLLKKEAPSLRVRVVNVVDLLVLGTPGDHPHALSDDVFDSIFTHDKPVVIAHHGYPSSVKQLLFDRGSGIGQSRFNVLGYMEQGTTTTPYMMKLYNGVGRYDLAQQALRGVLKLGNQIPVVADAHLLISNWQHKNRSIEKYAMEHGEDPEELATTVMFEA